MNAPVFLPASEEADLIVARWFREAEEALARKLFHPDAPEAGEEVEEQPEAPEPYTLSPEQERAEYEAEIEDNQRQYGSEDDSYALASAGWVEE